MWTKFVISGLAGVSGWMFVHPFDVLKVRMQVNKSKVGAAGTLMNIYTKEGVGGLYSGLSAAVTRQLTYTTLRLGLYDVIRDKLTEGRSDIPFYLKLCTGLTAGATAATICCPVEVSLVRMQADGNRPIADRRNYKHIFDAMHRVTAEEGITTLWRGVVPTVFRGAVVSTTQLATYDQAKSMLKSLNILRDGIGLHLASSLISGFVYCFTSLPLDICKTRMQDQKPDPKTGILPYTSVFQALYKIPQQEGILALWKGFGPYFARGGGHTVGMFIFAEQYKTIVKNMYASK
uniref:Mitochondrial 2-oxoglutarate/malate carrier protein n=1 Tax=Lotharella globosa TaxID=91324 RepID=A0A7S4E1E5_9EUKA